MIVLASSFIILFADLIAVLAILGMGLFGFLHGLFLTIVAGILVLTGFVGAVALSPAGARLLEAADCPAQCSLPVAYFLILAAALGGGRLLVGAFVEEDDVRLTRIVDQILGAAVGLATGVLVGGAILVGWSMCELPRGLQLYAQSMRVDCGVRALWTFVRCMEPGSHERERLFQGDVFRPNGDPRSNGALLHASEPFDDADGDWLHDESERYLDYNRDGSFTRDQAVVDHSGSAPGQRDMGLIDSYWLSSWRRLRVMHAPRITSSRHGDFSVDDGDIVYTAVAEDPDVGDDLKYSLKANEDDEARLLTIGEKTGTVRIRGTELDPAVHDLWFWVVVTDRAGMTDEQQVNIVVRPPRRK